MTVGKAWVCSLGTLITAGINSSHELLELAAVGDFSREINVR